MNIEITGEQIVGAVCRAIHAALPNIPIHKDAIDQNFDEPCFFVWNSETETEPVIWPKFREKHNIEVRYYPPERNTQQSDGMDMGAKLIEVLSRITIKKDDEESLPIFATNYTRKVIDDALAISVTYKTEGFIHETRAGSMVDITANIIEKE